MPEVGVTLTAGGSLLITGNDGSDGVTIQSDVVDRQYVVSDAAAQLSVTGITGATTSNDGHLAFIPFDSVTGNQIISNLGGGDDGLTIDFTLGSFSKSLVYDGGDGNDTLTITGFGVVSTYTPADVSGSGTMTVGSDQISFSAIEPVNYNVAGGTFVLDLPGATTDNITLSASTLTTDATKAAIDVAGTVNGVAFEDVRSARGVDSDQYA